MINLTASDIIHTSNSKADVVVISQNGNTAKTNTPLIPGCIYRFERNEGIAIDTDTLLLSNAHKARRGYLVIIDTTPKLSNKVFSPCGSLAIQVRIPPGHKPGSIGYTLYKDGNRVLIGNDLEQPGVLYYQGTTTWVPGHYHLHVKYYLMPGLSPSLFKHLSWTLGEVKEVIDLEGKVVVLSSK